MKKIVIIIMIIFSTLIFSEKLTTDGKLHLDKLLGSWQSGLFFIEKNKNNGKIEIVYPDGVYEFKIVKNLLVSDEFIYAFDTKYKTLVVVDKKLNIVEKIPRIDKEIEKCIKENTFG